jgi:hypothetical protein
MFLAAMSELTLAISMLKSGRILNNKFDVEVHPVLFDTGALHGNYISRYFVNKLPKLFEQPCKALMEAFT